MILQPLSEQAVAHIAYNLRQADREELAANMWGFNSSAIARQLIDQAAHGFVACADDGVPVAVLAVVPWWPGVYQAAMFATPRWPEVALSVTRHALKVWSPAIRALGVRRAHAFSHAEHKQAHRWLELLGGVCEGRMERFGAGGEDFLIYRLE